MNNFGASNSNTFSNNLQDSYSSLPSLSSTSTSTTSTTFSNNSASFLGVNWKVWIFIIIVLAFLGFNIFLYLAEGTQTIADFFSPITGWFGNTGKQIAYVSATGLKAGVDNTAEFIDTGLDAVQQATSGEISGSSVGTTTTTNAQVETPLQAFEKYEKMQADELTNALNSAQNEDNVNNYQASESFSSLQSGGKTGWCYIGEEQGFRSCAQVGANDKCMSGDIFPTHDVCINPNLRA